MKTNEHITGACTTRGSPGGLSMTLEEIIYAILLIVLGPFLLCCIYENFKGLTLKDLINDIRRGIWMPNALTEKTAINGGKHNASI